MPNEKRKLKYVGEQREGQHALFIFDSGVDKGQGPIEVGQTYEFSEATAVDLLRDCPKDWEDAAPTPKHARKSAKKE